MALASVVKEKFGVDLSTEMVEGALKEANARVARPKANGEVDGKVAGGKKADGQR